MKERGLNLAVKYQLKRLFWQPLNEVLFLLSTLTSLMQLMPSDQALLHCAKEVDLFILGQVLEQLQTFLLCFSFREWDQNFQKLRKIAIVR